MTALFVLTVVAVLGVFLYHQAMKYGRGNLILGLKRYFDLNYELPEVETARIQDGLNDLFGHLTREYGPGWKLTVLRQEGIHNLVMVEQLYKQEQLPSSFSVTETVWTGNDAGGKFVKDTVLEPRQKEN